MILSFMFVCVWHHSSFCVFSWQDKRYDHLKVGGYKKRNMYGWMAHNKSNNKHFENSWNLISLIFINYCTLLKYIAVSVWDTCAICSALALSTVLSLWASLRSLAMARRFSLTSLFDFFCSLKSLARWSLSLSSISKPPSVLSNLSITRKTSIVSKQIPYTCTHLANKSGEKMTTMTNPTPRIWSCGWVPDSLVFTVWYITIVAVVLPDPIS